MKNEYFVQIPKLSHTSEMVKQADVASFKILKKTIGQFCLALYTNSDMSEKMMMR